MRIEQAHPETLYFECKNGKGLKKILFFDEETKTRSQAYPKQTEHIDMLTVAYTHI